MIRPNMATMLGYIATDAKVAGNVLQDLVRDAANKSFNRITIDGDTSTNDCCMLIATGRLHCRRSHPPPASCSASSSRRFSRCSWKWPRPSSAMARERPSSSPCRSTGRQSSGMPGRRLRRGPFAADQDCTVRVRPELGAHPRRRGVCRCAGSGCEQDRCLPRRGLHRQPGGRSPSYTEEQGAAVMAREEISIRIELGRGSCSETIWTTDCPTST